MPLVAKKQFSQNFLVDEYARTRVLEAMKKVVDASPNLPILEIGPGAGDLTTHIATWGREFLAIELDPEAVEYLQGLEIPTMTLHHGDAYKMIFEKDKLLAKDFVMLSSLPYQVGSRILVDMGVNYPAVNFAVIHQREVVRKTQASGNFTFFGAWLNIFWECNHAFDLSPHCFKPQPKVVSSVLLGKSKLANLPEFWHDENNRKIAKETLKKITANPNKTLRNNLQNLGWTKDQINSFNSEYSLDNKERLSFFSYFDRLSNILTFKAKNGI